ncbi:hypothetical protein BHE74_00018402 [Ensete ventricosum]|nr:hypothetical protein BHE74_00018402 [Ensete ventricosum]
MIWLPSWIMSGQLAITGLGRQTLASWLWLQAVDGDNSGREQSKSREEARGGLVIWEEEEVVVFRITGPRCGELMTRSPKFMYRHGATVDTLVNSNRIKPC